MKKNTFFNSSLKELEKILHTIKKQYIYIFHMLKGYIAIFNFLLFSFFWKNKKERREIGPVKHHEI